jgi:DNA-binding transcriptional LysR family regulator
MANADLLSAMAVLVSAVDTGSFTAAARRHRMTPSAVSKLVARLEHRLGARLLLRSTRRMTLTEEGVRFCERARTILDEVDQLEREVASRRAAPSGLVRMSAPLLFGELMLMPALIEFQRRFPQVRFDVELSDRVVDFFESALDLTVRMTREPPLSSVARKIGEDRRVLCASPAYLRAHPAPRVLADLEHHDCIVFSGRHSGDQWRLHPERGNPDVVSLRVRGSMRCNNTRAAHHAALAGVGIAELPLLLVRDDLRRGALLPLLDELVPAERSIYLVYLSSRMLPTAVRELLKFLELTFTTSALLDPELPSPRRRRAPSAVAARA